ncbi:MAG TPA: hypothetical protein VIG38_00180 [Hyphomicrobium sp.]|jgi:hypothetical protein
MHLAFDDHKEIGKQSLRLGSHEAELNRIDTAIVAAARSRTRLPSPSKIFGALSDASIACADVVEAYEGKPLPRNVRAGLFQLHCAITDLSASLKAYAVLAIKGRC